MRNAFQEELDSIHQTLVNMGKIVEESMSAATRVLLEAKLELPGRVSKEDGSSDDMRRE